MVEYQWLKIPEGHVVLGDTLYRKIDTAIDTLTPFGYVFQGPCGTGKTTLQHVIRESLKQRWAKEVQDREMGGEIIGMPTANEILSPIDIWSDYRDFVSSYYSDKNEGYKRRSTQLNAQVMVLVDLGAEDKFGNAAHEYMAILLERYYSYVKDNSEKGIKSWCLISTNYDAEGIEKKYGTRVLDRLSELCKVVPFTHGSFRDEKYGEHIIEKLI